MSDNFCWAIGLMSGTSLDGVDAALLRTDGKQIAERGPWLTLPYDDAFRESLVLATQQQADIPAVAQELTLRHAQAVKALLEQANMTAADVKVMGFHGQTIDHRPDMGLTWQIGNPSLLSSMCGIDVVFDFRTKDMAEGGQGAPLVPLYHAALVRDLPKPLAILNIGGIANVTWIDDEKQSPWVLAFDTGPGNALMDDMTQRRTGAHYDKGGALALAGTPDSVAIQGYLYDTYFASPPPKSLDRYDFGIEPVLHLETPDALATLAAFTVEAVVRAQDYFPHPPKQWLVAGGGRHNGAIMKMLTEKLGNVQPVEAAGWEGDALEAQAFGFLAMRVLNRLPTSLPTLTGARKPVCGGVIYPA